MGVRRLMTGREVEVREVTVECPNGHISVTVRTKAEIVRDSTEYDPFVQAATPPHPATTPEAHLMLTPGDTCGVCDAEYEFQMP